MKNSMIAALAGHAIERYDVVLYGFFAAMLAPKFFPINEDMALIAGFGSFAAGYLMRPLGGIFFGYLGDKIGRKNAFLYSILLVTIPTLTISFLPTYDQIGIYAPIILILSRLMQGFCSGGEFSGAAIYVGEHATASKEGFYGSLVCATGFLGVAIGTSIGALCMTSCMPSWGWRIPFFLGSVVTLASYFIRRKMKETPDFIRMKSGRHIVNNPLKLVFTNHRNNFLCTIGIGACGHIFLYTTTVYLNTIYKNILQIEQSTIFTINTFLIVYWMVMVTIMGYLSDKFGIKKLMCYSALSVFIFAYPIFLLLYKDVTLVSCLVSQMILILCSSGFFGPATGLFKKLFPANQRYSGIALGITIGQALLGGTTPLIATYLVMVTGNTISPAFYMSFGALLGYMGVIKMRDSKSIN